MLSLDRERIAVLKKFRGVERSDRPSRLPFSRPYYNLGSGFKKLLPMKSSEKSKLTLKDVIPHTAQWSRGELEALRRLTDALLKVSSEEERVIPALHLMLQGRQSGGYIEHKSINGKSYCYLRYRCDGKLRSVYLGRSQCFVSEGSARSDAARGFRNSSRTLCRFLKISQRFAPITPLDLAIYSAALENPSSQIERIIDGKPPQVRSQGNERQRKSNGF